MTLGQQGKVDDAIVAYRNVKREDGAEQYARAQFNLGVTLGQQGKVDDAIAAYRNVKREDSAGQYAKAQLYLGMTLEQQGNVEQALKAFQNIVLSDDVEIYAKVQVLIKIMEVENDDIRKNLLSINDKLYEVLDSLRVTHINEQFIAHYTRPSTLFRLLPNKFAKENEKEFSCFRLNTINGVNDPTEGKILSGYLGINDIKDESYITFISCFTFNHDSLNQFRLYGKENNKEVTGVSVVFDRVQFFDQNREKSISLDYSLQRVKDIKKEIEKKDELLVDKLPLYRCIYLDPESSYLSLARREEITFHREKIEGKFERYNSKLSHNKKNVIRLIAEIKDCIKGILDDKSVNLDQDLLQIISEIILPLKYLVKHIAFKEEQECRIVYISPLDNPKVILDTEHNQTYVEYAVSVKESIHKVYISQGAKIYEENFRILLGENKVRNSSNPFRNKD